MKFKRTYVKVSIGRVALWAFLLSYFPLFLTLSAQTLTVKAPTNVQTGDNFRLTYTLDTQDASNFRVGDIPEGLELITGPYTSTQHSIHVVNGHTTSNSSITYTFVISASKPGTYTIAPAHVTAGGKTIASKEAKLTVSGQPTNTGGAPKMHEEADAKRRTRDAGTAITGNDLFIKVSANKQRVHEQEPILLTYKVYTLVNLVRLEGKMPDLTGFHTQEIELPQQKSFHVENINGKNYQCVTWSQYVMFPQMTGKLEIPSITFNGTVIQQNRNVDPFEAFFNGGSGYVEVKRSIKAPAVTIQVDPLPDRPAGFSGGVGKFTITAQADNTEVKANDPVNVRVVISGTGNMKLLKQPVVTFPKDFDTYDAKVTDKTRLTANGLEGNMVYDFLAVPRNQGTYVIPPIEFTYYDTATDKYKTLKTDSITLTVQKGDRTGSADVRPDEELAQIRPIKQGRQTTTNGRGVPLWSPGSSTYWLTIALMVLVFLLLLIIFRHRAMRNADVVGRKSKKANKVATKRLRAADRLMKQGRQGEFYDEVLHALWGYIGDRLNIPVEQLSRDNITDRLTVRGVDGVTIDTFVSAIDECEFERYAPGDAQGNMDKTYTSAMTAITDIENAMKRRKEKKILLFTFYFLLFTFPITSFAVTKENADSAYMRGDYQQAAHDYEELCRETADGAVYYNLGNAYYRLDNIPQAILAYERALVLMPGDADIRFNLEMARAKTIDKITPRSEMFFVTWYRSVVSSNDTDGWGAIAIGSILLALVMALFYLFSGSMLMRKTGFFVCVIAVVVFILSNIFAYQQKITRENRSGAIVMTSSAAMKKTPATDAADVIVIHEGTKVTIIDDSMEEWKGVTLSDGRVGWILTTQIERI